MLCVAGHWRGIHAWRGSTCSCVAGHCRGIHAWRGSTAFCVAGHWRGIHAWRGSTAFCVAGHCRGIHAWRGSTVLCVAGHCRGRICANNRRSTPCVDALRSGVMNPGRGLRPGLNSDRLIAPWSPGFGRLCRAARGIHAWRGSTVFLRRGSLRYPRMAWIYGFLRRGSLPRYPRMAWIYGFCVAGHWWGRIRVWRGSTAGRHRSLPGPVRYTSPFFRRTRLAISLLIAITAVSAAIDRNCRRVCDSDSSRPKISASTPRPITVRYG